MNNIRTEYGIIRTDAPNQQLINLVPDLVTEQDFHF